MHIEILVNGRVQRIETSQVIVLDSLGNPISASLDVGGAVWTEHARDEQDFGSMMHQLGRRAPQVRELVITPQR